jgi:hypothetical protein
MRTTQAPTPISATDWLCLGAMARVFPADAVDAAIATAGCQEGRKRLLPGRLMVYYAIAMTVCVATHAMCTGLLMLRVCGTAHGSGKRRAERQGHDAARAVPLQGLAHGGGCQGAAAGGKEQTMTSWVAARRSAT